METVLLSANINNIEDCADLAVEHGLGVEVMAFAYPNVLDANWKRTVQEYRRFLKPVTGPLSLHGPFMDMAPGSPDSRINAVCMQRYQQAIHIASELNAEKIVFHVNFITSIHSPTYRQQWHERNVVFWNVISDYAKQRGVTLCIENMWEFDPSLIINIVSEVNHPSLRACLDVGHSFLYGPDYDFESWLTTFEPWMVHMHMNNTHGRLDSHNALDDGVIDYNEILQQVRQLAVQPTIVLEIYDVQQMRDSLPFFQLKDEQPVEN